MVILFTSKLLRTTQLTWILRQDKILLDNKTFGILFDIHLLLGICLAQNNLFEYLLYFSKY